MSLSAMFDDTFPSKELTEEFRTFINLLETDELLSKKNLCSRILNMDANTAERHVINRKGFPYVMVGNIKRYPKKAVEEWIQEQTEYTNY